MARKIKKPKLRLKRSQVIKKTEENFDYHMSVSYTHLYLFLNTFL